MSNSTSVETLNSRAIGVLERAFGDVILSALHDEETVEIMCNEDGVIWQEKAGKGSSPITTITSDYASAVVEVISGYYEKEAKKNSPLIEAELPIGGYRFAGQLPPVVSQATFAIRKPMSRVMDLMEYLDSGVINKTQYDMIINGVKQKKTIIVIGGTGSGKTTMVCSISKEISKQFPSDRIVLIEDTKEMKCLSKNYVQYHTAPGVDMTQLLRTSLRMRPDRIFVGEVRGHEALDLLDAWNTGHEGGLATLHANSAELGLRRLKSLVSRNPHAPVDIEQLISETVDMVIHIQRGKQGRKVTDIIEVEGFNNGKYQLKRGTS